MHNPLVIEYIETIKNSQLDNNIKDVIVSLLETSSDHNMALVFEKISKILNDNLSADTYVLSLLEKNEETLLNLEKLIDNNNSPTSVVNNDVLPVIPDADPISIPVPVPDTQTLPDQTLISNVQDQISQLTEQTTPAVPDVVSEEILQQPSIADISTTSDGNSVPTEPTIEERKKLAQEEEAKKIEDVLNQIQTMKNDAALAAQDLKTASDTSNTPAVPVQY